MTAKEPLTLDTSTAVTMTRGLRRRLVALTLLLLLICMSVLVLLHGHLSSKEEKPYTLEDLALIYNHETRKPSPKTTTTLAPRQIHVKNIPPPSLHINMTMRHVEYFFFLFLEDKSIRCENDVRLGNMHEGGWNVCLSPPFNLKEPCIVFSFGIGNDWQFDDSVSKIYGCRVLAFDPSMNEPDSRRSPLIEFRRIGLGARNEINKDGWRMKTLGTHLKDEGYWGVPVDYVKIDIEYDEWDVLKTALNEGALRYVKQLGFEMHSRHFLMAMDRKVMDEEKELRKTGSRKSRELIEKLDFVHMYESIKQVEIFNFRKFNYRKNPFGTYRSNFTKKERSCCYELHYINTEFLNENFTIVHEKDSKLFH